MNIYTLSSDIYITIYTDIKIYDYEQFHILCRKHIKIDRYYKILNDGNIIYTTLYIHNSVEMLYIRLRMRSY